MKIKFSVTAYNKVGLGWGVSRARKQGKNIKYTIKRGEDKIGCRYAYSFKYIAKWKVNVIL